MWYFYEDGDDEPDEGGLGAPERDWASEDQGPEEEEEEDNKQDNNRDRKKDKDDKDDKSENDGENSTDSEGESSTENSTDQGSQPDDQLNREDVQKDLQEKDRELNEQKNNENGSKNDPKDSKGDKSGKNSGQGKDANTPQGNNANAPQSNGGNMANKGVQQAGQDAGKELGKEAGKEAAKEGAKEASKEAAKQAGKQAAKEGAKQAGKQVASKGIFATPVGWIILLVIVIIIVLIGTISFFMLMPGQILGKLKDFAMGFMDAVAALFVGQQNIIYDAELAEVANYIEEMGYDLKGEGFVSKDLKDGDQIDVMKKEGHEVVYHKDEQEPDPQQGVMRAEDGKVSYIKSDPIYKYIVSDNLCYIVRNSNSNFQDALDGKVFGMDFGLF